MRISLIARGVPGAVVSDNKTILNGVVLAISDSQLHVDIGFQREGNAGGVLGNLQPERVIPGEESSGCRPAPVGSRDRLTGRERAVA